MRISACLILLSLISLLSFVSAQAVNNPGDAYVLDNRNKDTQSEESSFLRMAAKDNSTTSNISGITIVSAKQNTSLFASPDILVNGTLFYSALSITCLLWVTGRFIDYKTDRLERFTEANVHKL